jgi:hypothetical protein
LGVVVGAVDIVETVPTAIDQAELVPAAAALVEAVEQILVAQPARDTRAADLLT